jgi:hypothetical protein
MLINPGLYQLLLVRIKPISLDISNFFKIVWEVFSLEIQNTLIKCVLIR